MNRNTNAIVNEIMDKNDILLQFEVAGSCSDYDFFGRMNERIRREEVTNAIEQMPDDILEKVLVNNDIIIKEALPREDGYCPYCGHDCEDEYIQISGRFVNDRYYDQVKCTRCGETFDKVYMMVQLKSQAVKTTNELLREE